MACNRLDSASLIPICWSIGNHSPWIISQNIHRRHLTTAQRAAVAVEYERIYAETKTVGKHTGHEEKFPHDDRAPQASDEAGELLNVSGRSVRDAKFVAQNDPEAFDKIKRGCSRPCKVPVAF